MNVMQVLIIDADPALRLLVAEGVVSIGYLVLQAKDEQEAFQHIKQGPIDLVLLGLEGSGAKGFETAKALRAHQPEDWFPIIYLTASLDDDAYVRGVKAGGDAYMDMPINLARLQAKIIAMERIYGLRKQLKAAQFGLAKLNSTLKYLSMYDQLTGLANRRNFDDTLRREFKVAQREKMPLSLLIGDIDFFKAYNDGFGSKAGDDCLCAVATVIASVSKRPSDLVCRYGGEEFAAILPRTDLQGATEIAEKINQSLHKRNIAYPESSVSDRVSLSIGLACFSGQYVYAYELTKAADQALHCAKANGRNRLEVLA